MTLFIWQEELAVESTLDSNVRTRCCVSMLKILVYPLLNDATIWLGSLLTRSTEAGIPSSWLSLNTLSAGAASVVFHKRRVPSMSRTTSAGVPHCRPALTPRPCGPAEGLSALKDHKNRRGRRWDWWCSSSGSGHQCHRCSTAHHCYS